MAQGFYNWIQEKHGTAAATDKALSDVPIEKCRNPEGPSHCSVHGRMMAEENKMDELKPSSKKLSYEDKIPDSVIDDQTAGSAVRFFDENVPNWRDDVRRDAVIEEEDGVSDDDIDEALEASMPVKRGNHTVGSVMSEIVDQFSRSRTPA